MSLAPIKPGDAVVHAVAAEAMSRARPSEDTKLDTIMRHILGALKAVEDLREELRSRRT